MVLLPLLLVVVLVLPKIYTAILFGIMAAIGAYELMQGTGLVKNFRLCIYAMVTALLISVLLGIPGYGWLIGVMLFLFICVLFGEVLLSHAKLPFEKLAITFMAGGVVPFMLTALVRLHGMEEGRFYILIPFVLAFLSDTGAYFTGRAFGKHKLAPVISPNKTVEGVLGGAVGGVAGMIIYCAVLQLGFGFQVNYFYAALYGVVGSFAAVFGDLCFSAVKRQTGIKDYGNLIPGHGGVLDRFDSTSVVAPLVEILMILIPVAVR